MKARFICNVSNARLLRNRIDKGEGFEAEYVVERVVYLSKREFIPFRERLLEDEPNIAKYQEDMFIDENGVFHVLMPACSISSKRRSISATADASAPAAFLGSLTMGQYRWGMFLYILNSTFLGSMSMSLSSSGFAL